MKTKTFRLRYAEIEQRKQRFSVGKVNVSIEVKPWPVKTDSGLDGGIETVTLVEKSGIAAVGRTVCIPTDKFDFRFGAKLALERALDVTYKTMAHPVFGSPFVVSGKLIEGETAGKIWLEFNKLLPK